MIIKIKDIQIYYEEIGDGIPVVNIHGYEIDHRAMKGCLEPVFESYPGYTRIYFDLPGMGHSGTSAAIENSDDMLDIVLEFIEHVTGGQDFIITGLSYGGLLARGILYKMFSNILGLVLLCPVIYFDRSRRELPEFRLFEKDDLLISQLSKDEYMSIDQFLVLQTRPIWERYKKEIFPALSLPNQDLIEKIRNSDFSFDVDDLEQPFDRPALILLGRYDVSVGYKDAWKIYDNFSNASFVVINKAGHSLQMEQPWLFDAHMKTWLEQINILCNGLHS
ncbi:MAG: alpha/beta hydrolase [Desulfobacteraceae bacterium]|nr:alpha/beta hydrolase [Desulfobacteraceae bacterium]